MYLHTVASYSYIHPYLCLNFFFKHIPHMMHMIAIMIKSPVPPMMTPTVLPLFSVDGFSESETCKI